MITIHDNQFDLGNTDDVQHILEEMIDEHGVSNVLEAIATIMSEKADHIRSSYDDRTLANYYDHTALTIRRLMEEEGK